jgi:hypothetical protein
MERVTNYTKLRDFLLANPGSTRKEIYVKHFNVDAKLPWNKGGHQLENIISRTYNKGFIRGDYSVKPIKFYAK